MAAGIERRGCGKENEDEMMAKIEVLAEGLNFPEGPIVMPDGTLLVVEIKSGHLTAVAASGKLTRIVQLGGGPNGAAIGPDGHCYVCNNGGFEWLKKNGFTQPHGIATDSQGGAIQR